MFDKNGIPYRECIVGNIIGKHYLGEKKDIKYGTKHFAPGTKVYCAFIYGGMGHESVKVVGKPRKSFPMIEIVLRTHYLKNFRIEKVYAPRIITFVDKHRGGCALPEGLFQSLKSHISIEIQEEPVIDTLNNVNKELAIQLFSFVQRFNDDHPLHKVQTEPAAITSYRYTSAIDGFVHFFYENNLLRADYFDIQKIFFKNYSDKDWLRGLNEKEVLQSLSLIVRKDRFIDASLPP